LIARPENPLFGANILHVLTVPELWLFEVTIGRNANVQILEVKGGNFQISLTKPYKECACHQNASFKPLTAFIGPMGGPVAMRMKLKNPKRKKEKNGRLTMTISRMCRHVPFGPTDLNICVWGGVTDVINCAKHDENRFRGSGAGRP